MIFSKDFWFSEKFLIFQNFFDFRQNFSIFQKNFVVSKIVRFFNTIVSVFHRKELAFPGWAVITSKTIKSSVGSIPSLSKLLNHVRKQISDSCQCDMKNIITRGIFFSYLTRQSLVRYEKNSTRDDIFHITLTLVRYPLFLPHFNPQQWKIAM